MSRKNLTPESLKDWWLAVLQLVVSTAVFIIGLTLVIIGACHYPPEMGLVQDGVILMAVSPITASISMLFLKFLKYKVDSKTEREDLAKELKDIKKHMKK